MISHFENLEGEGDYRTRSMPCLRPLMRPSLNRGKALFATRLETVTTAWRSWISILPTSDAASPPASPVNEPRMSPGRIVSVRPEEMDSVSHLRLSERVTSESASPRGCGSGPEHEVS